MNKIYILIGFLFFSSFVFSQEFVEHGLTSNSALFGQHKKLKSIKSAFIHDTISLGANGIVDDFSYNGPYPDTAIWLDDQVYINRTFPKAPITLGVATFDGLDSDGHPYDFTAPHGSSRSADSLTSKAIDLNYPASDSVYLSFYYQPQGYGDAPAPIDSLALQFKDASGKWKNVWGTMGRTLATFDSSWTLVMIPIKDATYLIDGFQFRFYNKATVNGNTDHWNIDYVYLNKNRSKDDKVFEDVAFVYNTPPLLKTYSAMPWRQYNASFMKSNYSTTIRNNYSATKNGSFQYKIYDALGNQVNTTYSGGNNNIDPFATSGYMNYAPFTSPPLNYTIPALTKAEQYTIECTVVTAPDNIHNNDTVRYTQDLTNYFAYDDGTAENAYGLSVLYSQLAEKFTLNVPDSLQYVDIYFNPYETNATLYTFNLMVWSDFNGSPGLPVYKNTTASSPAYGTMMRNQFIRFRFDVPLYLPAGIFYVGFQQNTTQFLNVGVDENTNTQTQTFYRTAAFWNSPAPFAGSLMLRPVFGSIQEIATDIAESAPEKKTSVSVYPNPANDRLFIKTTDINEAIHYSIIDIVGKVVVDNTRYSDYVDISTLDNGIYFIQTSTENITRNIKFIKVK